MVQKIKLDNGIIVGWGQHSKSPMELGLSTLNGIDYWLFGLTKDTFKQLQSKLFADKYDLLTYLGVGVDPEPDQAEGVVFYDGTVPFYDPFSEAAEIGEDVAKEKKEKTKTFKADSLANGFTLQANPLAEGKEPFYMESYILGNNEFYISGGMSGILNLEEFKQLRKFMKQVMNKMKENYPDPDEEKGGKAVLKVDAPWQTTDTQIEVLKQIIGKELNKALGDDEELSEKKQELLEKVALNTVKAVLSSWAYEQQMNEAYTSTPDVGVPIKEGLEKAFVDLEVQVDPSVPEGNMFIAKKEKEHAKQQALDAILSTSYVVPPVDAEAGTTWVDPKSGQTWVKNKDFAWETKTKDDKDTLLKALEEIAMDEPFEFVGSNTTTKTEES